MHIQGDALMHPPQSLNQSQMHSQKKQQFSKGGVKISIVNVHNEFNFHNNIIINPPSTKKQKVPSTFTKSHKS